MLANRKMESRPQCHEGHEDETVQAYGLGAEVWAIMERNLSFKDKSHDPHEVCRSEVACATCLTSGGGVRADVHYRS